LEEVLFTLPNPRPRRAEKLSFAKDWMKWKTNSSTSQFGLRSLCLWQLEFFWPVWSTFPTHSIRSPNLSTSFFIPHSGSFICLSPFHLFCLSLFRSFCLCLFHLSCLHLFHLFYFILFSRPTALSTAPFRSTKSKKCEFRFDRRFDRRKECVRSTPWNL
jgi:hypothetical protein